MTNLISANTIQSNNGTEEEEGDTPNKLNILNSQDQELSLDLDPNDIVPQTLFTSYNLENDIISLSSSNCNKFFLSHFNIRSLNKNFDQFHTFVNKLKFNHGVIGISETWLKDTSPSSLFSIEGYRLILNNRLNKRGGGVAFYITENLNYVLLDDFNLMSEVIESIFIEIKVPNRRSIIIGEIYRPPNSSMPEFTEILQNLLSNEYFYNKTCFIMGDFNLNLLQCNENPSCQDFLNLMLSKSFVPLIKKPTRVSDASSSLIDNIFLNNPLPDITSGIVVSDISDHFPIYTISSLNLISRSNSHPFSSGIRDTSESNLNKLREKLKKINWSVVYNQDDVNLSFDYFLHILTTNYNSIIPLHQSTRSTRKKIPKQPWISKSLLKSINRKNKLFHKYKNDPNTVNKSRYVRYRNVLTSSIRLARQMYFSRQFEKHKHDLKSTWKVINEALNTKKDTNFPQHIIEEGRKIEDPTEIAELFNDFFVNIGPNLAKDIPNTDKDFHIFLKNRNSQSLFFEPVIEEEIKDIVNNLNTKKGSGCDGITNFLLKSIINEIITPLTYILNLSMSSGKVPQKMKLAKVVPVFKKGDRDYVNNYRPISLLTSISKILERLVYKRTLKFLVNCKILGDSQFGFRKNHSTTHALLTFLDKVAHAIDDTSHTIGVFLDFSKAFDTINHNILIYKLRHYGIRGRALDWFQDYLTNRKQFVSINGKESELKSISCGVPQGSLLGPLLFILYINDLQNSSQLLSFICFADDSNLFLSHRNPHTLVSTLNNELKNVQSWINANKLSLNIDKTHFMLFSNTLQILPDKVRIDNIELSQVVCTKFLGLYIDSDLSWKSHILYLSKILSRNTGILNKLKSFFPSHTLLSVYSTLITPYLNYGILVWGNASKTLLDTLFHIQKRAIRNVNHARYLSHTNKLFYKNNILKIVDLFYYNIGIFMYQLAANQLPNIFLQMFTKNSSIHNYPTRQREAYHLPRTRTIFAQKTIFFTGPRYWNDLPAQTKNSSSLFAFKRRLKQLLLYSYFVNNE